MTCGPAGWGVRGRGGREAVLYVRRAGRLCVRASGSVGGGVKMYRPWHLSCKQIAHEKPTLQQHRRTARETTTPGPAVDGFNRQLFAATVR
ncbi:hypothetical protein QTP88_026889 [Uroleucon formosanum]